MLPLKKKASIVFEVENKMRPETAVTKLVKPRLNKMKSNQVKSFDIILPNFKPILEVKSQGNNTVLDSLKSKFFMDA